MASIVLLLSELLGGAGSASVLAANCITGGHSLRVWFLEAPVAAKGDRALEGAKQGTAAAEEEEEETSFEDLVTVPRIAVDVMWP